MTDLKTCLLLIFAFAFSESHTSTGALGKAIHYSFEAPIHIESTYKDVCYGIEDDGVGAILITDCGGYLNVMIATLSFGLLKSNPTKRDPYISAARAYLVAKRSKCFLQSVDDLGGRIFEISYKCELP